MLKGDRCADFKVWNFGRTVKLYDHSWLEKNWDVNDSEEENSLLQQQNWFCSLFYLVTQGIMMNIPN